MLRGRVSKIPIGLAAALLVPGVGLSRVYFGVHYPTDVLGGYIASAIWLKCTFGVVQAAEWYARCKARHPAPTIGDQQRIEGCELRLREFFHLRFIFTVYSWWT